MSFVFFTGECQTCQASHRKLPYLDYDPVHSCPIRHLKKPGAWSLDHPRDGEVRLCHRNTWMSQDVGKWWSDQWVISPTYTWIMVYIYIYWGYNPNWLTIMILTSVQRDIQVVVFSSQVKFLFHVFFLVGRFWWIVNHQYPWIRHDFLGGAP